MILLHLDDRVKYWFFLLILLSLILLTGCINNKHNISVKDPIIIGQGNVTLSNKTNVTILLEMVQGEYFQDDEPLSPFTTNFNGQFQFRVKNEATEEILFNENVEFEDSTMCFSEMFDIEADDYNADGNPDFVIGQHGGGNYNVFKIYTILPDGTVEISSIEGSVIMASIKVFSMKLNKVNNKSFSVPIYNNAIAELVDVMYTWDGEKYKQQS